MKYKLKWVDIPTPRAVNFLVNYLLKPSSFYMDEQR